MPDHARAHSPVEQPRGPRTLSPDQPPDGTLPAQPPANAARRRQALRALGLGLITGAADDDWSAIGTYAAAGATVGLAFLWTAPVLFPKDDGSNQEVEEPDAEPMYQHRAASMPRTPL